MATEKKIVSASSVAAKAEAEGKPKSSAPPPKKGVTAEDKKQALIRRVIAVVLWLIAIAAECFTIFYLLKRTEINNFIFWIVAMIAVMSIFAIIGSQLWKGANRFDPAPRSKPFRFFVQNQLGAIITIIAFLPLIIVIFTDKNMDKKDRTIAGVVGIVALLIVGATSIDYNPPSLDEVDELTAVAIAYTGKDEVFWVSGGSVYHLCAYYPDDTTIIPPLARGDSETNPIVAGTVAEAIDAGKTRLSMYGFKECGLVEGEPAYGHLVPNYPSGNDDPDDDEPGDDEEPGDEPS